MKSTRWICSALLTAALVVAGCTKSEPTPPRPPAPAPPAPTGAPTAALPPGHPAIGMNSPALPPGSVADVTNPQWNVPDGWEAGHPSSVRRASYVVKSPTGQSADIAVTVFPGDVGGLLANVNRWRGQIGLAPITPDQVAALTTAIEANGVTGTVVDFTGDQPPAGATDRQRMLVATLSHAGNSWFFKMTGDAPLVELKRAEFLAFVKSVKF